MLNRALMVIDVQNEYFNGILPISYPSESFKNILKVMDMASIYEIPIILVQHSALTKNSKTFLKGSMEWEIHPEVLKRDYDLIIEKNLPGSFTNTDLDQYLKDCGINSIAVCGYMTQMCCDTTSRQAFHLGYDVEFLSDATGTRDISNGAGEIKAKELHQAILITQAMKFSQVMSSEDWIKSIKK
jgi:nicotinamidase-related amidase